MTAEPITLQVLNPNTGVLKITCGHCQHKQTVEPAVRWDTPSEKGGWIYGSGADFCEECDEAFVSTKWRSRETFGRIFHMVAGE